MAQQIDMKSREVELLEGKLKQSTHGQQLEELEALKASIGRSKAVCSLLYLCNS